MTHLHPSDADLHFADGSHRSTSPSTNGRVIARYERRIQRHLADHASQPEEEPSK